MHIADILKDSKPSLSFEFFPPRSTAAWEDLYQAIRELEPLRPTFVSVTYGAGGGTRELTHDLVVRIKQTTSIPPVPHLTCVGHSEQEVMDILTRYAAAGVSNILALRGDPPISGGKFEPHPQGYASAAELVEGLHKLHPFEISVSAYPETHPEALSAISDIDFLKRKMDAGASRAITQFFFEPETFFRFRDAVAAAGVDAEIVPGIMPVTNFAAIQRMSAMTGRFCAVSSKRGWTTWTTAAVDPRVKV